MGTDDSTPEEPQDSRAEAWKREVGGTVEWAVMFQVFYFHFDTEPERCWSYYPQSTDPRLVFQFDEFDEFDDADE